MTSTSTAPAPRRAPGRSFAGLLWAIVPVLVVVVLLVVWQQAGDRPQTVTVDPAPDVAYARRIAPVPFPDLAPLPDGWRATSSEVDAPAGEKRSPVTLRIGYVTPGDSYAQIVVSDQAAPVLLREVAAGATATGTTPVGSASWSRYRSGRGETVLVRTVARATVVVSGDAPDAELVTAAASVR